MVALPDRALTSMAKLTLTALTVPLFVILNLLVNVCPSKQSGRSRVDSLLNDRLGTHGGIDTLAVVVLMG